MFRLVFEVTSSNDEAVLYSDPRDGAYRHHKTFKRGSRITVPEHVGLSVELPVDCLLDGETA
ncbi:hypothetical protein [Streptomyces sp. NPDC047014]|uniref:hypothetical protein n=1 Tax=Streptomyces sp. NPDC047014 TaxID=3155736 RepID=UPI0033C6C8B0